ncbi:endonuclease/exonuclease/phosphatase family protein [Falsiroseomonas sp. E2-1-a20]|uniref:endonuclease/exonuclease/phosphatase family protein n=1 Tax=Falsiroseomonas sp. E2-1-a20 TaxID=3239300 RepID=UPI003F2B387D
MNGGGTIASAALLVLFVLAVLLVLLSVLPRLHSQSWWVHVWDFPRPQVAGVLVPVLAGLVVLGDPGSPAMLGILAAGGLALVVQLRRIWPFTRLHATQAQTAAGCAADLSLSLLTANLKLRNSGAERLLAQIRRMRPDVVFVVELDSSWSDALEPLKQDYPHHLVHPRPDFGGMALYARLPLVDAQVQFLLDSYVPSICAGLRLRSGAVVAFHGVHPKPPTLFGHGTVQRDAELLLAARSAGCGPRPAVMAGDLNAVAWSRETGLFMRIGGLMDPRIGRGLFATFPATWPWFLRWPADHVFFSGEFRLLHLAKLPEIGPDHLPLYAELCLEPDGPQPKPGPVEPAATASLIAGGRRKAAAFEPPPQQVPDAGRHPDALGELPHGRRLLAEATDKVQPDRVMFHIDVAAAITRPTTSAAKSCRAVARSRPSHTPSNTRSSGSREAGQTATHDAAARSAVHSTAVR